MSLEETAAALARIQTEQVPWQQHNFPERTEWQCLLGVQEEYFEAQEALGDLALYLDAVADHSIFLIDLCTALGVSTPLAFKIGWDIADFAGRPWPRHLGKLTHHYLKLMQGIRGDAAYHRAAMRNHIGCLFATLERDVELLGISYAATLSDTWDEVKTRDWIAYPDTGKPPLCGQPSAFAEASCILPKDHDGDHVWVLD